MDSAKSTLYTWGVVLVTLTFLYESWKAGKLSVPKHYFVLVAVLLPVVYLLSALLTTPTSLALIGYNLEVGTFGYMLIGGAVLVIASSVFSDSSRVLQALVALFASFSVLALFVLVQILSGGKWLGLGNFAGVMGNPLGAWTDLAMVFGILSLLVVLVLGMLPIKGIVKWLLYVVFALSTALLVLIHFSTALAMTLAFSVIIYFYFAKIEKDYLSSESSKSGKMRFVGQTTFLPLLLGVVSLIFLINPTVSKTAGTLGEVVSGSLGVSNVDVRPTLSATLSVSKAVLSQVALLGSGPNTFEQDWLIFKSVDVNTTPFWSTSFPFGVGFIPTQIATTGILGSALWLAFLVLLLTLAVKSLNHIPESRGARFALVSTLSVSLFLWVGTLVYTPSSSVMLIAFIFAGLFTAMSVDVGAVGKKVFEFNDSPQTRLVSTTMLVLVLICTLSFGWFGVKKTLADYYYKNAVDLANTSGAPFSKIEAELEKAVKLAPVDTHYNALSQINFTKAQTAASSATGTPEQNRALFQDSLGKSIQAARASVAVNPANYRNWVNLGLVYTSLVPEPLNVEGAYENAQYAYGEAVKRNPNNPELPLLLARLEIGKGNADNARAYIRNSIALKEDYADAYLLLAQLEVEQKNIPGAITSTEALTRLAPNNAGIFFELGVLKYSSNNLDGAETAFNQALSLSPDYANAKYYLALTLQKLGRIDEARQELEELIISNPDSTELKAMLEELNKPAKKK